MKCKLLFLLAPMLLWCFATSHAQGWSGILDPSRAINWSGAGVTGGIPNRTTVCSTLNPGATAAQIRSAIAACPVGQVVFLNPGNYTIGPLDIPTSNVTLRGAGADQTKLFFTDNTGGCGGYGGGYAASQSICIHNGTNNNFFFPTNTATFTIPGNPANSQGVTTATFSSVTNLAVGRQVTLDQLDDAASGGYPTSSDVVVCANTSCTIEGGNNFARTNRALMQVVTVTAINGTNVTFTPGLYMPNWRASQSPGAYWSSSPPISDFGIENLSIDLAGNGSASGIGFTNATNCWLKGIRLVIPAKTGLGQAALVIILNPSSHITVRDSYFYGSFASANVQYGISAAGASDSLIENNIVENNNAPVLAVGADTGSVYGYNFVTDSWYTTSFQRHETGEFMSLFEGNDAAGFYADEFHGTGGFETAFRNHFSPDVISAAATSGFAILAYHRFENVVGNILGAPFWNAYQTTGTAPTGNEVYALNYGNGGTIAADSRVAATLMRWGNWDNITSTNPTGTNDATGKRFLSSEVPSTLTSYANPVPASQTLPASFYLGGRPRFWATPYGTPPWPPIGPDVANGNINTTAIPTGGHANKIPTRLCWENAALDSAYGSTNPRVRVFNAATCYASSTASAPNPPTGLTVVVR